MIGTISIYLVKTREWLEGQKEGQDAGIQEQDGEEELVPVSHGGKNHSCLVLLGLNFGGAKTTLIY